MTDTAGVACVLLAGGLARRMGGGDKALLPLRGRPLIAHAIDAIRDQVGPLVINANGEPERFAAFGLPVVADSVPGFAGPLAGVLAGLDWARENAPGCRWVLSVPTDTPQFPADLVARLLMAVQAQGADMACAASLGRAHPVFGLWPVALAEDLRKALVEDDERKIDAFTARYRLATVEWPAAQDVDPFFNVNAPEDLAWLEAWRMAREQEAIHGPAPLSARHVVGLVVERRDPVSAWGNGQWRPLEVLTDAPPLTDWRLLRREDGRRVFLASGVALELHRSDLASYRYNLESDAPRLYVVLRPKDEETASVVLLSAAPDEAQLFMDTGEDVVEALPMPPAVQALVGAFVARHPPPPPHRKRKRKPHAPAR